MNELNQLERRLRSWTPRRPSASIKARLFAKTVALALDEEPLEPISWRWLAPAMALCIGAIMVLARSPHAGLGEAGGSRLMPTFALSNLDFATYFAAAGHNDHNLLRSTFEWTNGAHSSTTPPSFFDRNGYRE